MTDMRATERLLEVIADRVANTRYHIEHESADLRGIVRWDADQILEAITELRRRGDTPVRAEDLRAALEHVDDDQSPRFSALIDRLENALGGKMRP